MREVTATAFVLQLALVNKFHKDVKSKKKQLLRLIKQHSGTRRDIISHVIRNNRISQNIDEVVQDHVGAIDNINIYRAGGAVGMITVNRNYHPIFVDVVEEEDKEYALTMEMGILETAFGEILKMGYTPGTTAVAVMFKGDGFSGIPLSVTLNRNDISFISRG